ncbi:nuclear transport factor 2 family protein [Streptomyces sp. NPDC058195]|uniref:nuclear transport factor 2 family protein n=1 Tax=Streptomyces sp. NPDC058195 TaxID=3346375 RepID=UPI0036E04C0D
MTTTADLRAAVETYWSAAEARDWEALAATLADDVLYELPQARERVRGKERYLRFSQAFPGAWSVRVERVVADAGTRRAAVRTRFIMNAAGSGAPGRPEAPRRSAAGSGACETPGELLTLHFFAFDEAGRITGITDFRSGPYEPPAGREHLAERC